MTAIQPTEENVVAVIHQLIDQFGGEINSLEGDLLKAADSNQSKDEPGRP